MQKGLNHNKVIAPSCFNVHKPDINQIQFPASYRSGLKGSFIFAL